MDTNDAIFQQALDELYVSLIKVMRLARGRLSTEQQLQYVISSLGDLAREIPGGNSGPIHVENPVVVNSVVVNPVKPDIPQPSVDITQEAREYKYATMPEMRDADGAWGFRNKYLEADDDTHYYKVSIINDEIAEFELKPGKATVDALADNPLIAPKEMVIITGSSNHTIIDIIQKGRLVRDGKFWIVSQPCKIKWS